MTLILTAVHRSGVIQVVDRLVTRPATGGAEQFDPRANKIVLFAARDAFLTLAYTGLAYVNGLPTDQWIAETLRNKPVAPGQDGHRPATFSFERVANWPSVGQAVERLTSGLEAAMSRLTPAAWRSEPLTIVIAGWQLYRAKRPRVFGLTIAKPVGLSAPAVVRLPRHLGRRVVLITEPDGHLSSEEQRAVLAVVPGATAVVAEQAMVAEIRKVAARTDVVGPHCLCVMLPPPWVGWAKVRYDSPHLDVAHLVTEQATLPIPAAFTPWILTERLTVAPSIISGGGSETQVGPWRLQVEGTGERLDPHAPMGLQFTQDRPPQPE